MTDLPIPSGPTNAEIIDAAYRMLSITDALFGRTEEETASGIAELRMMMADWPFDQLGYDFHSAAPGERSGIAAKHMTAVAAALAERLSGPTGKAMTATGMRQRATSYSRLCADVAVMTPAQFPAGTLSGAGNRRYGRTYLPRPV